MPFTALLKHTMTIRKQSSEKDAHGQPVKDFDAENEQSGINCRLRAATGREMTMLAVRDKTEISHMLYVDPEIEIDEGDQVALVSDSGGNPLLKDADVVLVQTRTGLIGAAHHKAVALRVLRSDD